MSAARGPVFVRASAARRLFKCPRPGHTGLGAAAEQQQVRRQASAGPPARSEPNELGRFRTEQAVALLAPIPRQTATPPPSEAALAAAARRGSGECGATSSTPSPARSSRPCLHTFAAAVTWPRPSAGGSSGTVARSRPRVRPSAELGSVGAHRERSAGCASSSSSAEAPPRPTPTLSSRSRSARAFHTAGRARAVCTWSTLGVLVVVALEDLHRQAGPSTRAASAVRALAAARYLAKARTRELCQAAFKTARTPCQTAASGRLQRGT